MRPAMIPTLPMIGLAWLLLAGAALAQPAERAGVATAVNPDARGTPPGATTRILAVGLDVARNERVSTDAGGQVQVLFLDRSSIMVGPNSDLVIDTFVYSPAQGTGRLAVTTGRGVFRYVGGVISKSSEVTIGTPAGSLGIRGGVVVWETQAPGDGRPPETTATLWHGESLRVTGAGSTEMVRRPGFTVRIVAGQPPGAPLRLPPGQAAPALAQLEGKPANAAGPNAGLAVIQALDRSGIASLGSANDPRSYAGSPVRAAVAAAGLGVPARAARVLGQAQQESIRDSLPPVPIPLRPSLPNPPGPPAPPL